jgi:CarD family transcriptional regulator
MDFSIGDKVVHPRHGFGQITGLERLDLVEGFERYYVIKIPDRGLTVHLPVRKTEELGVRPVMSPAKLARALDTLRGRPRPLSEDHKERQARIREKLETGSPLRIAETLRDLSWRERRARLTEADAELLSRGREFLAAEIALVTDAKVADAKQTIDTALMAAMANEPEMQERGQAVKTPGRASRAQRGSQTLLGIG